MRRDIAGDLLDEGVAFDADSFHAIDIAGHRDGGAGGAIELRAQARNGSLCVIGTLPCAFVAVRGPGARRGGHRKRSSQGEGDSGDAGHAIASASAS